MATAPVLLEAFNPGPMTGEGNNTYLITPESGDAILVDAGVGDERHLAAIDRELAARSARLAGILATHGHRDHVAGSTALARRHPDAVFAKFPWAEYDERDAVRWQPLAEGDEIVMDRDTMRVLHTPGHSPDHLVFWHPAARAAFTGDLVIAGSSVMIQWSRGGNMTDYLASLTRLMRLEPLTLYPAHGPVIIDPAGVLTGYVDHRRVRERQVLDALGAGLTTVPAIAGRVYDRLDSALRLTAQENVRAHLEKLKTEGLAACDDGLWVPTRAGTQREGAGEGF